MREIRVFEYLKRSHINSEMEELNAQMKSLIAHLLSGAVFLVIGVWFGYDRGVKNHLFFDSPARIAVYDAYLRDGRLVEHIEGEIRYQINILDSMQNSTSAILLNHPVHAGMEEVFLEYKNKIENSERIQRLRNEIDENNN